MLKKILSLDEKLLLCFFAEGKGRRDEIISLITTVSVQREIIYTHGE